MTERHRQLLEILDTDLSPERARPGDLPNVRFLLDQWLRQAPAGQAGAVTTLADSGGVVFVGKESAQSLSDDALRALHREMQALVRFTMRGGVWQGSGGLPTFEMMPVPGKHLTLWGGVRAVALGSARWLAGQARSPLTFCPEPECDRLFYRVRRQKYCSRQCVMRANQRTHRAEKTAQKTVKKTAQKTVKKTAQKTVKKTAQKTVKKTARSHRRSGGRRNG